ncbi:MAG: DNA repair protein RecO [Candidatus Peribacteraceae bacterium]|nr:DNA repair protein RecO [Candidatus Peribacteraceae bacterium]
MPRPLSDEAIVLRSYNVGETDRFCVLLTKSHGRIAVRVQGARKLLSRRGRGLLPLHRVMIQWEESSAGARITGSHCLNPHAAAWADPATLAVAQEGIKMLIRLTEEATPIQDVYALAVEFLEACHGGHPSHLLNMFALRLFDLLGLLPSVTHSAVTHAMLRENQALVYSPSDGGISAMEEGRKGILLSPLLRSLLLKLNETALTALQPCPPSLLAELDRFVSVLSGSQLGSSLSSLRFSLPPAAIPTCHVNGRA